MTSHDLRDCFAVMVTLWLVISGIQVSYQSAYKFVLLLICNAYAFVEDESYNSFISVPTDSKLQLVPLLQS